MLSDIGRFNRAGTLAAASDVFDNGQSVGEFLNSCGIGQCFIKHYFVPMASAIWSSTPQSILDFPARFMISFFQNHGLMQIRNRPQWRTIRGGAKEYVQALLEPIADRIRLSSSVQSVRRVEQGVEVNSCNRPPEMFDEVVFASHANQTLQMLAEPSESEQQILGSIPYHANTAVLHTDAGLLPRRQRAWASWNYRIAESDDQAASVTYDLSRLQNHNSPSPILLTLNPTTPIDPASVLRSFNYHHPAYSAAAITAQQRFCEINGVNRTHFCGAYWGYGFHEDGVNSALAVTQNFGLGLDSCTVASTRGQLVTDAVNL